MEDKFEIKIPGIDFTIKSHKIYTVLPKPDPSAPDGLKEHGTTKIIHPDITDTVSAPFNVDMNVWDTGFYEFSPCLRGLSEEERKAHVENVQKYIVKKVEQIKGEGILDHSPNNRFFDEFPIALYNKLSFNTEDPIQLLMLYLVILGKDLAPKEYVGHPKFRKAAYQVVNREKEISSKAQASIDRSKATGEFHSLLNSNKKKLRIILEYLGISSTIISDDDTYITVFQKFLEDKHDGYRNGKIFLETVEKFKGDGSEELYIFDNLNSLATKGELKIFKQEYFLGDVNLGGSLKTAAYIVSQNDDLKVALMEKVSALEEASEEESTSKET